MNITQKLKDLLSRSGLREDEISFYINTLKKPNSSIYDIAKKSKVPKDRAYKIYESLEDKKLVTFEKSGKIKKIKCEPINSFVENLYGKSRKFFHIAENLNEIKSFLPLLASPYQNPNIQVFTEDELAEQFTDMSYMDYENILAYGDFEMLVNAMGTEPDIQFIKRRLKKGKKCFHIITNPGEYSWKLIKNGEREMRYHKVIQDKKLSGHFTSFMPELNKTVIWNKDNKGRVNAALIDNPIVMQFHQHMYDVFAEIAELKSFLKSEK